MNESVCTCADEQRFPENHMNPLEPNLTILGSIEEASDDDKLVSSDTAADIQNESPVLSFGFAGLLPWLDSAWPPESSFKSIRESLEESLQDTDDLNEIQTAYQDRLSTLEDTQVWFSSGLANMSIESAGQVFFYNLRHTSEPTPLILSNNNSKNFIYSLLPQEKILSEDERDALELINGCALLFSKQENEFEIPTGEVVFYYAIDICGSLSERSEVAFFVSSAILKCKKTYSVILFRHSSSFLLAFACSVKEEARIVFSNWISPFDIDEGQISRMMADICSSVSAKRFYDDLVYYAARDYYTHSETNIYLRYEIVPSSYGSYPYSGYGSCSDNHFFSWEDYIEIVETVQGEQQAKYGTDYIYWDYCQIDQNGNEYQIDFDLLEIDMDIHADDNLLEEGDDSDFFDETLQVCSAPSEAYDDPIALLDWISTHEMEPRPQPNDKKATSHLHGSNTGQGKSSVLEHPQLRSSNTYHVIENADAQHALATLVGILIEAKIDFVDTRQSDGTIWLIGGKELAGIADILAGIGYEFVYSASRKDGYPGWYLK